MTYYINPLWIYLMNVSGSLKTAFLIFGGIGLIAVGICLIGACIDSEYETDKINKKRFNKIIPGFAISIFILILGIATPNKETCIEMTIASVATKENVQTVKEEVYEIIDYVTEKMDGDK